MLHIAEYRKGRAIEGYFFIGRMLLTMTNSLKILLIGLVLFSSICSALGQSKSTIILSQLKQIHDLENGILLVPLLDVSESAGIVMQRNSKSQQSKEINQARISAFHEHFSFCEVRYYFMGDSAEISTGRRLNKLMDQNLQTLDSGGIYMKELFIASVITSIEQVDPVVEILNHRRIKRRKKRADKIDAKAYQLSILLYDETDIKTASDLAHKRDKLDDKSANLTATDVYRENFSKPTSVETGNSYIKSIRYNDTGHLPREMVKSKNGKTKTTEPTSFEIESGYYSSFNPNHPSFVIRRMFPVGHSSSQNKSYLFNWNYFARIHGAVDEKRKYEESTKGLDQNLQTQRDYLEKRLNWHKSH
jgi:hypothetical protein